MESWAKMTLFRSTADVKQKVSKSLIFTAQVEKCGLGKRGLFFIGEKFLSFQGLDERILWIPPKLWCPSTVLYGATTWKTTVWTLTAKEIWELKFVLPVNTEFPHNTFPNYGLLEFHYYIQRFYSIGTCFFWFMNWQRIYESYEMSSFLHQISPHGMKTAQARWMC